MKLENKTVEMAGLEFSDISSEEYREYVFKGDSGTHHVRIEKPMLLNVSKNGHRILDNNDVSHYIPQGWIHLFWKAANGHPKFVR